MFDPKCERVDAGPIWVRLLGLPFHFWMEDIFRQIGDAIGTYLTFDASFQTTGCMDFVRILVHLDLSNGLLEHINIQWRNTTRLQLLDYDGVPFRCRRCQKVGHLSKECPLNGGLLRRATRQEPEEQEEQNHGEPVQEDLIRVHEEQHWHTISSIERTDTLTGTKSMATTPAQTTQKKRGRPPHRPPPLQPGPSMAASGDSNTSGSRTQLQIVCPKKLRSGSQVSG